MNTPSARRHAWLELLRPPNLPTVPGDPLAGFALAAARGSGADWRIAWAPAAAAVLLYAAGLIWNDCADVAKDRIERPARPLPSGRIAPRHAALGGALLAVAGIATAWIASPVTAAVAALLALLVLTYDVAPRHLPRVRALLMGACRGTSLLMGAAAAGRPFAAPPLIAAGGLTLMIAAITWIARRETEPVRIGPIRWMPALAMAATGTGFLVPAASAHSVAAWAALALALGVAAHYGMRLRGVPEPAVVGRSIGGLIRALLPFQAALCLIAGGTATFVAIALLLAWPLSAALGRRFYAS